VSTPVIRVENLSKSYRIGLPPQDDQGRMAFLRKAAGTFGYLASTLRDASEAEILWAIRDVSFEVEQGEVVGLVGRNGAGKSTLLKILSRITDPTHGRAFINGRVGSLLEVGTGFHPELTGRENIYLNGAVLGMKRAEIDAKFDEIAAFSGVEKFLDTPVKRYSSGMSVRLAFSVAAHLQPEVLLVDEVLAVGDAAFQKKCLGKMGDVAAEGRTVLFVSHNMVAVQNLCNRAIWLQEGRLVADSNANDIVMQYLQAANPGLREQVWEEMERAPGNDLVRLRRLSVRPAQGSPEEAITMETPFVVEVEFWNLTSDLFLDVRLFLYTEYDVVALGADTSYEPEWHGRQFPEGIFHTECLIPGNWLNSGNYRVGVEIVKDGRRKVYVQESDWLNFDITELGERGGTWYGKERGIFRPRLQWKTELVSQSQGIEEEMALP
jgi:lipopolysaccharide transport system ATP-binding protein